MPHSTYIITAPCIGCKDTGCVDVCPVGAIYGKGENWDQLFIHPEECIECRLCEDACPPQAIFHLTEVPAKWNSSIAKNYQRFELDPPA